LALKQASQAQLLTKTLDEEHPGEVREVPFLEGNGDFSQRSRHWTLSYFLSRFVSKPILREYPPFAPSETSMFFQSSFMQIAHH
jgi:hypothetical protein